MELSEITIHGYKSIEDLTIKIPKLKNKTFILIGKNGSGKSNVLDAISLPYKMINNESVSSSIRNQKLHESEDTYITYKYTNCTSKEVFRYLEDYCLIPEKLISKISVEYLVITIKRSFNGDWNWKIDIKSNINYNNKIFIKNNNSENHNYEIKFKNDLEEDDRDDFTEISKEELNDIIKKYFIQYFSYLMINMVEWKANDDYLLNDYINLSEFKNTLNNIPLYNIFSLAGYNTDSKIIEIIEQIEKDESARYRLAKKLTKILNKYLEQKWPEHEVVTEIIIENNLLFKLFIHDSADDDCYLLASDRSQGFKQFLSLLLSISLENTNDELINTLIVIDEPEVYLHPSGIRWMFKELLKIGENNIVFISTHSQFMLDKKTPERHYLLKKINNITEMKRIEAHENMFDDEILNAGFGINVINDFLAENKLLVEGQSDKIIIQKALNKINKNKLNFAITNGNGQNIPQTVSTMIFNDVEPIVVVDDDKVGRKMKEDITKISKSIKAYTLFDLTNTITLNGTIEDALPIKFVQSKMNEILKNNGLKNISLIPGNPYIKQLRAWSSKELNRKCKSKEITKEKINEIEYEVKNSIVDFDEKKITEKQCPILYNIASKIMEIFLEDI